MEGCRRYFGPTGLLAVVLFCSAPAPYTAPDADLNLDGLVDVADLQCQSLVFYYLALGPEGEGLSCESGADCLAALGDGFHCRKGFGTATVCLPQCLVKEVALGATSATACPDPEASDFDCLGLTAKHNSDLNCDGWIGNQDFTFLVAVLMQKLGWPGSADYDGDGRLNFCDDDSDGDGLPDPVDCHLLDHTVTDCDDDNPCTADSCLDEACQHQLSSGAPCDDGDPCTEADLCVDGACAGNQISCDDGNQCTDDLCHAGACTHFFNEQPCDDEDACTPDDACLLGVCVGSGEVDCDDGNFCTDDGCEPASGCYQENNIMPCEDGDQCTISDQCWQGECIAGGPVSCKDGNICTDDSCDPATGCFFPANTMPCDDGDACTTGDACADSTCVPGEPTDCDDLNPCTDDFCLPESGCGTTPVADGDGCLLEGVCVGSCAAGECLDIAQEVCDGQDNDCDDHVDEVCVSVFYLTLKSGRALGAVGDHELDMNTGLPVTGAASHEGGSVHWGIGAIAVSAGQ